MTISTATVFEVRANGTTNGGGGYVTGASGTDHSQQDAVQIARTDIVIDAVTDTNITSAATAFTTDEIGNLINIISGTGFTTGRYEITAVDGGNIATLDRAVGTTSSTGGNGNMGGAMTFIDANLEDIEDGNIIYVKADATHTLSAAISISNVTLEADPPYLYGYNTTRGDNPTGTDRPLIAGGANVVTFGRYWVVNFLRGTGTGTEVFKMGSTTGSLYQVKADNSSGTASRSGLEAGASGVFHFAMCEAICTNGRAILTLADSSVYGCYLHDSVNGCLVSSGTGHASIIHNIFDTVTTGVTLTGTGNDGVICNNTFYNGTTGINVNRPVATIMNNVIDNFTTGVNRVATGSPLIIDYNNYSNNTADTSNVTKGSNATSGAPGFADAANGDFAPGAGVKATSSLGVFPGGLTTGFLDQGAVQHEDAGGGGGTIARFAGF